MKTILYNLIQLNATILDWLTKQYLIRYGGCTKKIKRSGQILIKYLERWVAEIIYYQDECGFEIASLSEGGKERYLTPLHKTIKIEVIGNIYENKELLRWEYY